MRLLLSSKTVSPSGTASVRRASTLVACSLLLLAGSAAAGSTTQEGASGSAPAAGGRARPSILVLLVDDQGYADLGCAEDSRAQTPGIDRLATEGVRFRQAYVVAPMCSPSRAAILTGRYPERYGYFRNASSSAGLPKDEVTLAQVLKEAGYATGIVGKWHLGEGYSRHPLRRGFDSFVGFLGAWHSNYPANVSGYPNSLQRDGQEVRFRGYLNDVLTEEAVGFLKSHADEDFFLYLSYGLLHTPLENPPNWRSDRDDRRHTYLGMLRSLDQSVERVLSALDELGRARDTLVVYLSDNGGGDGNGALNDPLRGYKLSLFEGGLRVPMILRWPGVLPAGRTIDEPVSSLDLFPTCLAAAHVDPPGDRELDGRDLLPLVRGEVEGPFHEGLFFMIDDDRWAVRAGPWKLVREGKVGPALFDLDDDPQESRDRAADEPEVAERLQAAFGAWSEDMREPTDAPAKKHHRRD